MAINLVNRYRQLLSGVPKGNFYKSDGTVLPHRSGTYELRITTGIPTREYGIFVNEDYRGLVTTDGDGIAILNIALFKGRNDLKLIDAVTKQATATTLTTREYATWMAGQAEVIESIDEGVEQVLLDSRLATASISLIDEVFGQTVKTGNDFNYDLDTYRGLLQELRTAYRYYGSTLGGIQRVVRAFTQVNPLIYDRQFGPTWILGKDIISPADDTSTRTYYTTSALPNINASGAGVEVSNISNTVGVGTGTLKLYGTISPKRLSWEAPDGGEGVSIAVDGSGEYTLFSENYFDLVIGVPGPYNISAGDNDELAIEIDGKGIIIITLTAGAAVPASTIATDINAALVASSMYGVAYGSVASAYDQFLSGNPMIALTTPNNTTNGSVKIYTNQDVDAAQTLFDLPVVRGGLSTSYIVGNTSIVLSASTNMDVWPTATVEDPIRVIIGKAIYHPTGTPTAAPPPALPIDTELIFVTDVNRSTSTLTIAAPGLQLNHDQDELIYLEGETPYRRDVVQNEREITVIIDDESLLPAVDTTDTVIVQGTGAPDGWIVETNAGAPVTPLGFSEHTYFDIDRDLTFDINDDGMVSIPIPDEILNYKGYTANVIIWGRIDDPSRPAVHNTIDSIGVSFDNQATYSYAAPTVLGQSVNALWRPSEYLRTVLIDPDATRMWVQIKTSAVGNGNFTIHKVRVTVPSVHGGLYLGDGTIPRNEQAIKSGQFLFVWSPEPLTSSEEKSIGVDVVTQTDSHIDQIAPDIAWLDKFNVSEYDISDNSLNVKGVFSETEFLLGSLINLELVLGAPPRFTYLKPTLVSEVTQTVVFSPIPAHIASLTIPSNEDVTNAVLFEDDVPLTQDQWQFNSSLQIELVSAPSSTAIYEFRYDALIRFESGTIDLGTTFANYIWFADYHVFTRPEIEPVEADVTTGIQFDATGTAVLPERSNENQIEATLTEDIGLTSRIVPSTQWSFIDAQRIQISLGAFNPAAIYEFKYKARAQHPHSNVGVIVELRSAASAGGLTAVTYEQISINQPIDSSLRYHQMRVTLSGVRDVRDAKVMSLVIKGLNKTNTPVLFPP